MATAPYRCFAIAAPGLEPLVAHELQALGEQPRVDDGGVSWEGDARSLLRANLWLRTASRVVVRVATFRATAFHELERAAKKTDWGAFMPGGAGAEFKVTAKKSKLYHSDAIAERLAKAVPSPGPRPSAHGPTQLFIVRVHRDEFTISADTSGELLHMRGYRQEVAKAPLRETLAAALLLAAGYDGGHALVDPFCGSGTIPIEGALIARRVAPGINRAFAMEQWRDVPASIGEALRAEARAGQLAAAPAPIIGSDRDAGAVEAARTNASRAGVAADIAYSVRAVSGMDEVPAGGLVATNPPYGVRVGADVRDLYAQFGKVVKARASGCTVAMYLPEAHLGRQTRLPFEELYKTSNGGLRVSAVQASVS